MKQIYIITGNDNILIKNETYKIINSIQGDNIEPITYDLDENTIDALIEDASTYPFLASHKIIIVKNALFLSNSKQKKAEYPNLDLLENYIKKQAEFTYLIFQCPFKLNSSKISKELKKQAEVINLEDFSDASIENWVVKQLEVNNLQIENDALHELIKRTNGDFAIIISELSKITNYFDPGHNIDLDDIDLLVTRSLEDNVFELVNNFIAGNKTNSINIYYDLIKQNQEPIFIINLIANQLIFLYNAKFLADNYHLSDMKIAQRMDIKVGRIKYSKHLMKRLTLKQIKTLIHEINDLDFSIKSGKIDRHLGLELFILKN